MKINYLIILIFHLVSLNTYSFSYYENEQTDIPLIDIKKTYPQKNIYLDNIANIKYVPLYTSKDVLIGSISYLTYVNDTIIICDRSTRTIFFFDNEGRYLNSFCQKGQSNSEYYDITAFGVDADNKEIYIADYPTRYKIKVYNFDGVFLRGISIKNIWPSTLLNYDEDYLITYDRKDDYNYNQKKFNNYPYVLINKKNGSIINLPLKIDKKITNNYKINKDGTSLLTSLKMETLIKSNKNIIISDFSKEDIFIYKNKKLLTIIKRKLGSDTDLSCVSWENINYAFIHVEDKKNILPQKMESTEYKTNSKILLLDKTNKNIYETKLLLKDMPMLKDKIWNNYSKDIPDNHIIFSLSAEELIKLFNKNEIYGPLKDIASRVKFDDNPILVIAELK